MRRSVQRVDLVEIPVSPPVADHAPLILIELTEQDARDLAGQSVPEHIAENCRRALLWFDADEHGYAKGFTRGQRTQRRAG